MKENGFANKIAIVPNKPGSAPGHAERRAHYRHPFSALAEVIEPRTHTRLSCRATDLSFGGIYLDTITPFAAGTSILVRLTCKNRTFRAGAVVTYALAGMGMGLAFTPPLPVEQASALHSWIAELSDNLRAGPPTDFDPPVAAHSTKPPASPGGPDYLGSDYFDSNRLREGARELVDLLVRKKILTEVEASTLRSKFAADV